MESAGLTRPQRPNEWVGTEWADAEWVGTEARPYTGISRWHRDMLLAR